ncbi:MAG TPA: ribosome recycling factor [Candidatus Dojkabacteria bacterium]|nr:ribosome recycling factor [Candidatus Dojkabacteria bacterium]
MAGRGVSLEDGEKQIDSVITYVVEQFNTIRGGRVLASLLDEVQVEAYGGQSPLKQLANVTVVDSSTLAVQTWDQSLLKMVEKAIRLDERRFSLRIDGNVIYVKSAPLTEERRRDYVKVAKELAEEGRQRIRDIRNKMMTYVKELEDAKEISESDEKIMRDEVEKEVKSKMDKIESLLAEKEKDLLQI